MASSTLSGDDVFPRAEQRLSAKLVSHRPPPVGAATRRRAGAWPASAGSRWRAFSSWLPARPQIARHAHRRTGRRYRQAARVPGPEVAPPPWLAHLRFVTIAVLRRARRRSLSTCLMMRGCGSELPAAVVLSRCNVRATWPGLQARGVSEGGCAVAPFLARPSAFPTPCSRRGGGDNGPAARQALGGPGALELRHGAPPRRRRLRHPGP